MALLQLYVLFLATRIIQAAKRKRNKPDALTTFFVFKWKEEKKFPLKYLIKGMLFPRRRILT